MDAETSSLRLQYFYIIDFFSLGFLKSLDTYDIITMSEEEDEYSVAVEPELELEDEPQSWENFQSTAQLRRGEKEFEPDNTEIQRTMLQQSLNHMFSALAAPRAHTVKQNTKCYFTNDEILCELKGSYLQNMGTVKGRWCYLTPEEAIYLVERGTVEPYWITSRTSGSDELEGVPLDLQSVYGLVMKNLAEYQVYANLKRCGYIVLRHSIERENTTLTHTQKTNTDTFTRLWKSFTSTSLSKIVERCLRYVGVINYIPYTPNWLFSRFTKQRQLFASLQLKMALKTSSPPTNPLQITYDVWKPDPSFSKKSPPIPDFQIVVQDVHLNRFPTLSQAQDLFSRCSYKGQNQEHIRSEDLPRTPADKSKPKSKKQQPALGRNQARRMKEGYNGIILALVDNGIINYTRLSEARFYEEDVIPRESDFKKHNQGKR